MEEPLAAESPVIVSVPKEVKRDLSHEKRSELEQKHFESICTVIRVLDRYAGGGFRYRMVGSLVLETLLGGKYAPICKDGRVRDLDIVVDDDPEGVMALVESELKKLTARGSIICEVDLKPIHGTEYRSSKQLVPITKRTEGGGAALIFRDIEVELPRSFNDCVRAQIIGPDGSSVEFNAQTAQTIYAFYWRSFGVMRQKDRAHIRTARKLAKRAGVDIGEKGNPLKQTIKHFVRETWKRYPHILCAYGIYRKLNERFENLFGFPMISEKMTDKLRRR